MTASSDIFIEFDRERMEDAMQRRHFTLYWWVDHGVGRDGKQAGWRAQCFFANPRPYIRRHRKAGRRVRIGAPR